MKYDILDGLARLMGQDKGKAKTEEIEPYKYLLNKIGKKDVRVFYDDDPAF
jgi:hypothetical protein